MRRLLPLAALLAASCARPQPPGAPEPIPEPDLELVQFLDAEADLAEAAAEAELLAETGPDDGLPFGVAPADFDLPIEVNERVEFWLEYFTGRHREWVTTYLGRMGRYETRIRERLQARGLPQDLIWLAFIESGFTPRAYSHAHAAGLWQFIPGTARRYRLEVGRYVDERRDPIASTEAALSYLEDLYRMFGSWYLAAAAYNCGENRVLSALRAHAGGARGADSLFWVIAHALPTETRNYVPKLIAAAIIGHYPDRFGFGDVRRDPSEQFDVLDVPDATDLAVIAELIDADEAELRALNPHYPLGVTPPRRRVVVRVPTGKGELAASRYAALPAERRIRFLEHVIRRGETLSGIANQYRTSVALLQEANGIRDPGSIRAGRKLVIPTSAIAPAARSASQRAAVAAQSAASGSSATPAPRAPEAGSGATTYRVRSGDTLWRIARTHDLSVDQLRAWNDLAPDTPIRPGQRLRVVPPAQGTVLVVEVQAGDTLWGIARRHGVSPRDLMQWNALEESAVLRPGDRVEVRLQR